MIKALKTAFVFVGFSFCIACGANDDEPLDPIELDAGDMTDVVETDTDTAEDTADAELEVAPMSLSERPCPDGSNLTYDNFGEAFMLTWCTSCHSSDLPEGERADATLGIDLDTVEGVREHAERVWARTGDDNSTMPPIGVPDADERKALGEWLACETK